MLARNLFTVHEYHRMGEAGILHEDDRVKLIEGEIVEMAAIGTRHFTCQSVQHAGEVRIAYSLSQIAQLHAAPPQVVAARHGHWPEPG